MDRSLDEIISDRPRGKPRPEPRRGPPPPPRAPRREEFPRDGVRKNRYDERVNIDSDWVHDRYDDDEGYERNHRRRPVSERYEQSIRDVEPEGSKIRVDNLHYELTENDLRDLFSRIGPVTSVRLLYDNADRSRGTAFVTYEDYRDARLALDEYNGQNAYGQPIRLSLVPVAPTPKGSSLFDRIGRQGRSLLDRIEGGGNGISGGRGDGGGRRRNRSESPRRKSPFDDVDRYIPGGRRHSRSPIRRRGTPRESGRRPGQRKEGNVRQAGRRPRTDEEGHRVVGGRPKKTAEELDAEMADYWGSKGEPGLNSNRAGAARKGVADAPADAPTAPGDDDIDMIE